MPRCLIVATSHFPLDDKYTPNLDRFAPDYNNSNASGYCYAGVGKKSLAFLHKCNFTLLLVLG